MATAHLQQPNGAINATDAEAILQACLPARNIQEWKPAALLCRRFGVPDPFPGVKGARQSLVSHSNTQRVPERPTINKVTDNMHKVGGKLLHVGAHSQCSTSIMLLTFNNTLQTVKNQRYLLHTR